MNKIQTAAQLLCQARRSGDQIERLPEACRPQTLDEALLIQEEVSRLQAAEGEGIAGWKCLLPSEGRVVVAPIYQSLAFQNGTCSLAPLNNAAAIEPELAFVFSETLAPRETPYSEEEVYAAIGEVRMALELIRGRYRDPDSCQFPELLADGLFNQGIYLGPVVSESPADFPIQVEHSDENIRLDGHHPNADARVALPWLVNFLNERGYGIEAGQAVITGSYAGVINVPFTQITVRYGDFGTMTVDVKPS
ncbi:hypothetical protein [Gynuella sunshinyii]|uniref:2-keto-4-pentenoate hydratase n=1 Tax=Gynuella sunshinyii YC6258 TaxID=1445510 RepID=A0A0C5V9G2_9GAMM|nr:hypothetical protein [Gynuella sunshinyii]AJQ96010.1 2-keto-4-pentenoate hydratase [Gynuella sunshinyii YC6258]